MRKFIEEEDQFIRDHYLSLSSEEIGRLLERRGNTIRQRYALLGLWVPAVIKRKFYQEASFKKGLSPFNKGKTQTEWMTNEGMKKLHNAQFQKGCKPWHARNQFEVAKWVDKNGRKYLTIYLGDKKRMPLQRYIWEQANGPIAKDHKIIFKDRNTLNCNLDNLEIVSGGELMIRNSAHRFGHEIFKIIQLRGALNRQINKRLKQIK